MESGVLYSQPTPAPQSPPPVQRKSVSLTPWFVVGGIALLILMLVLAGGLIEKIFGLKTLPGVVLPTPTMIQTQATESGTTKAIVVPGWKTYSDPSGTFAIDYPQEFNLNGNYSESTFKGITLQKNASAQTASSSADISLKIIFLARSAKNASQMATEQTQVENLPASVIQPTKVYDEGAFEIPLKGGWGRGKIIFTEKDGTVYRLSSIIAAPLNTVPTHESLVNQIFSTFRILDPNTRGK